MRLEGLKKKSRAEIEPRPHSNASVELATRLERTTRDACVGPSLPHDPPFLGKSRWHVPAEHRHPST